MFKKLKSLFIIEDENSSSSTDKSSQQKQTRPDGPSRTSTPSHSVESMPFDKPHFDASHPPKGKLDTKFVNRLLGAIEESNLEGFDYLEYKQALQNLSKVEMDEATKFQSALAVAKTMGASKKELETSAEHYLKVLQTEENKFIDAFKNQMLRQVTQRSEEIKAAEAEIEKMKANIAAIEQKITQKRKSLETMKSNVDGAKEKVESTKIRFYEAYHVVAEQIKGDLQKIRQYLE